MKKTFKISENFYMTFCAFSMLLFSAQNAGKIGGLIDQALAAKPEKIDICHATNSHTNPYDNGKKEVSFDSIVTVPNGHDTHNGPVWYSGIADHSWGDIIPPFSWTECPEDESLYTSDDDNKVCNINLGRDGKKYADEITLNYAGKNWPEGENVFDNNCEIPAETCEETVNCPTACDYEGGTLEGECGEVVCQATEACETTPTPTPTPTVTPTVTPTITPTVTPTDTPKQPSTEHTGLSVQKLSCDEYDFRAEMEVKNGSNPLQDILVSFTYRGEKKDAYTNKDGYASVYFTFSGESVVKATPINGFESREAMATQETNCQEMGAGNSTINTPYTKVLGANTYAKTGVFEDIAMSLLGLSGATMTAVGTKLNAKKKN